VRILREMAAKGEVPLRQGAAQFLDDALAEGAQVGRCLERLVLSLLS